MRTEAQNQKKKRRKKRKKMRKKMIVGVCRQVMRCLYFLVLCPLRRMDM
jgi:hypothetical protein